MQRAIRDSCIVEIDHEPAADYRHEEAESCNSGTRRWVDDALDWLDRYWDDPELRSGFWSSGW
jgi:hypothetical protein